jgi:ArsR family transcriptional regulator, arsenate/arsenite/antimonite-responsive transcriptional repressor
MKDKKAARFDMDLFFRALADRSRLRLLNLIGDNEVCVCFFVEALGMSQPKISRHLGYLRRAGMVASRREGKWMHYRISAPSEPHAAAVLRAVRAALAHEQQMQLDRDRLAKLCCSPRIPSALKRAPKPTAIVRAGR